MTLGSRQELENTRRKLQEMEEAYAAASKRPFANEHVREATLSSLRRLINQFKEEIVCFEAHQSVLRKGG